MRVVLARPLLGGGILPQSAVLPLKKELLVTAQSGEKRLILRQAAVVERVPPVHKKDALRNHAILV